MKIKSHSILFYIFFDISALMTYFFLFLLFSYCGLLFNHEDEGIIEGVESAKGNYYLIISGEIYKDAHNRPEIFNKYREGYKLGEYNHPEIFNNYIGKRVKFKYKKIVRTRSPHTKTRILLSIHDINGVPIPYKNRYEKIYINENKYLLTTLTIIYIILIIYIRVTDKKKERGKKELVSKKAKKAVKAICKQNPFNGDILEIREEIDDLNHYERCIIKKDITQFSIYMLINMTINLNLKTNYEEVRVWIQSIYIKNGEEKFSLKDYLDECGEPSSFIFNEEFSFALNEVEKAESFLCYINNKLNETLNADYMKSIIKGAYWPNHLSV